MISIGEASEVLGVSISTLRRWDRELSNLKSRGKRRKNEGKSGNAKKRKETQK
ncbi:MAG: MerR family DNA-binding transcriptional regulator [Clostridiales bacterium]|nr:MerR family DNA-binding transcriptional regulator [Clostridiales bacterium]